ncbi:hypothetical protein B989_00316 [Brucella sp. 56/94]|nr:hypothetical protein B989_00316 [Brucella sp. 56/94]
MDRLRACFLRGLDDRIDVQIALRGCSRADTHRLVGHFHMQRPCIRIGINRHRGNAKLARRANDPAGDFSAIGNQYFLKHRIFSSRDAGGKPLHTFPHPALPHILKMPKRVGSTGAFSVAESDRPSTSRLLRGSTMPSSQSRAEA